MSHCCDIMKSNVEKTCAEHPVRSDCPDCLIAYSPRGDKYGLFIHDGGSSAIAISYCPWCGTHLPGNDVQMVHDND